MISRCRAHGDHNFALRERCASCPHVIFGTFSPRFFTISNLNVNMSLKTITNRLRSRDFFGLANITTKDISGAFSKLKKDPDDFHQKYKPLLQKRKALANEETQRDVFFGKIRLDDENKPQSHGQFEPSSEKLKFDTIAIKQLYDDDTGEQSVGESGPDAEEKIFEPGQDGPAVIDIGPDISLTDILNDFKIDPNDESLGKYANKAPLIFEFKTPIINDSELKLSGHQLDESEIEESINDASYRKEPTQTLVYEPEKDKIPFEELEPNSEEYWRRSEVELKNLEFDKSLDEKYDIERKNSMSAFEYLKKVRSQRVEPTAKGLKHRIENDNPYTFGAQVKLDSQGFKNYQNQVPDWTKCRHKDLLNFLKRSIIYHNYDILAVNKPYGIASHNEQLKGQGTENFDMNRLMHEVAAQMQIEKLYLAHRLDKTTTGILLFATSQERANQLNKLFKSDLIKKTYWCITVGVPSPWRGIIDMPIGENSLAGKKRSCPAPERVPAEYQLSKKYVEARRAITEYKVIKDNKFAALVEVEPKTGVKHQIRCHLSFGLNKPILGDHKYSHVDKFAPQTLPRPVLNMLHLRQPKARTLPTHLHAKKIVIPGAKANGETLFIEAPLPPHFRANMATLKLAPDNKASYGSTQ